jgi:hypothetical protein
MALVIRSVVKGPSADAILFDENEGERWPLGRFDVVTYGDDLRRVSSHVESPYGVRVAPSIEEGGRDGVD